MHATASVDDITITGVKIADGGLSAAWGGGHAPSTFDWFWLRDHGEDEASLDPKTLQRRVETFAIPADLRAVSAALEAGGRRLRLEWSDGGPPSLYSSEQLAALAGLAPGDEALAPDLPRRPWAQGSLPDPLPSVAFPEVLAGEAGRRAWLENIHVWGFSLVTEVPGDEAATRALALRIGPIRETIFGGLWTLSAEIAEHDDTAYSTQFLAPHTDSTYSHDAPGLQMFNCLEFDGRGGESILVDGLAIAETLRNERPEDFAILTRVMVPGRYVEPGVHLRAERPAIRLDGNGDFLQLSFNNYDRAPFRLPEAEMAAFYRAYGELNRRVNDRANWLTVPLRPGTALIFDNWRTLHGRMGYAGKRVFCGCYHNREDFESRLRVSRAGPKS